MTSHTWKRREAERKTWEYDWREGPPTSELVSYVYCTECGMSRGFAEHMGWMECRTGDAGERFMERVREFTEKNAIEGER